MSTLLGWTLKRSIDAVDRRLEAMMPRQEIQYQLEVMAQNYRRMEQEHLDFRARLVRMEIDFARVTKP
jgi:hypothetical protein